MRGYLSGLLYFLKMGTPVNDMFQAIVGVLDTYLKADTGPARMTGTPHPMLLSFKVYDHGAAFYRPDYTIVSFY